MPHFDLLPKYDWDKGCRVYEVYRDNELVFSSHDWMAAARELDALENREGCHNE